jgi:hypothetical protein
MARQVIDIGTVGNDGTGDSIRESFRKINENFRDLYAVFGEGGQIRTTDLDDWPDQYAPNQIFIANDFGDNILAKNLAAGEGIAITQNSTTVTIASTAASVESDISPKLGGPLNANEFVVAKIAEPTDTDAINLFNAIHGLAGSQAITEDDLVINKRYADQRYIRQSGGASGGGSVRVRFEPATPGEYTFTISVWENTSAGSNLARVVNHGLDTAYDGYAVKYNSTGANATPLNEVSTYYLKIVDENHFSLHNSELDAKAGTGKINVAVGSGTGVQTFVDAFYDATLLGNFATNEAMPRISTVRRSGDVMTGALTLYDHPGALAGQGTPNGDDDLQAATKLYVDSSAFASQINLFVSVSGDDAQVGTPPGKEGRAFAYAYATVGAACRKAEQLIEASAEEPGPYRQRIAFTVGPTTTNSTIQSVAFNGGTGYTAVQTLLSINREWIRAETIAYIDATYPDLFYNRDLCSRDVGLIIDAIIIDVLVGGNAQSIAAGKSYFRNASARIAATTQGAETIDGINYAKSLADYALQEINPPVIRQTVYSRQSSISASANLTMRQEVEDRFDIVVGFIQNGIDWNAAPIRSFGTGTVNVAVNNGGVGYVDQGIPSNVDIIPGKLIRGINSGAVGRIITYAPGATNDTISVNLLTPFNFITTEEVEFAEANKDLQVTVRVESGVYYEDYPIRVPTNVSVKGDEFRRTILRPKDRVSQSPWVTLYFYRDTRFDGLDLTTTYYPYATELLEDNNEFCKKELVAWIEEQIDQGELTITGYVSTVGAGSGNFDVTFNISPVVLAPTVGQTFTVSGNANPLYNVSANCSSSTTSTITLRYAGNPGVFGAGSTIARNFWYGFTYNAAKCGRDTGLIVEGLALDIKFGGNSNSYDRASLYYNGAVSKILGQESQTVAALVQLQVIIQNYILTNTVYPTLQGTVVQSTTLNNGEAAAITKVASLLDIYNDVIPTGLSALPAVYENPKYGYHYLKDSQRVINIGPSYTNAGNFDNAAKLIEINKEFIKEEVLLHVLAQPGVISFNNAKSKRDTGYIVDAIVSDLRNGGRAGVLDIASRFWDSAPTVTQAACQSGIAYIATLCQNIAANQTPGIVRQIVVQQVKDVSLISEAGVNTVLTNLISSVLFAFDPLYNPPKNNTELDVFMFNDAVKLHNLTGQGHGGFMCVLDPGGKVGSKSPYVQTCACFSKSINAQTFAGGMFIDGFSGRLRAEITNIANSGKTLTLSGLTFREPVAPTAFYYNGFRYQVDYVASWNPITGIAVVNLNPTTPWAGALIKITLETPGNRSMLANDFTQVNDLGYGIVAHNTGLTEQVSTFTYYCHTAYLASYGGQIRSVAGSNANGNFGLKAVGADPTELPDTVTLFEDMSQTANVFRYDDFSSDNQKSDTDLYITNYDYIPQAVSELEIDHKNGTIGRYELRSVTGTGINSSIRQYGITNISQAGTAVVTVHGNLPLNIASITKADPAVVTITPNSYTGTISGAAGAGPYTATIGSLDTTVSIITGQILTQTSGAGSFGTDTVCTVVSVDHAAGTVSVTSADAFTNGVVNFTSSHGITNGTVITITGVTGMVQINNGTYYAKNVSATTIELYSDDTLIPTIDSSTWSTYISGGLIEAATLFKTGERLRIAGVSGMTEVNANRYYARHFSRSVPATHLKIGKFYIIGTAGSTTWTSCGAANNSAGTGFYCTAVGSGSGIANETGYNFALYSDSALSSPLDSSAYTAYTSGGVTYEKFFYAITAATKANPCQITLNAAHHYSNGDLVKIENVAGMTQLTGLYYAKVNGSTTLQLYQDTTLVTPVISSTFGTFTTNATIVATSITANKVYKIITLGSTTNWNTLAGTTGATYNVGDIFTSVTTGSGDGTVQLQASIFGGQEVLLCGLSTSANDNREASGLVTQLHDGMNLSLRCLQNFRFTDIANVNPTRPSTALEFDSTLPTVYRIIAYNAALPNGAALPNNQAVLTSDVSFAYIRPTTDPTKIITVDPDDATKTMGSQVGDTKIAIYEFSGVENAQKRDLLNSQTLKFPYNGKMHRILGYTEAAGLLPPYITIGEFADKNSTDTISTGINKKFPTTQSTTLRAGLPALSSGNVTVKISTCRATGHDFLDIGTGGFNTTNYPTAIFGNPTIEPNQEAEVVEELKGRVFYVTTDQDGIFRVGPYFTVDQGTGTVTFAASIALSNLDGIGFKRGVTVSEFSTDATMTNNAADTVPVQSAVRGYIDKRLGLDHAGNTIPVPNLIGPGYMPLNGALAMKANMNIGGYLVRNLADPAAPTDAATANYVDIQVSSVDSFTKLLDVEIDNPDAGDIIMYIGTGDSTGDCFVNAHVTGDLALQFDSTANTVAAVVTPEAIVDSKIAKTADIQQQKLAIANAQVGGIFGITPVPITGITPNSPFAGQATVAYSVLGGTPYIAGQTISIRGVIPAAYNGDYVVVSSTTSQTVITCAITSSYTSGGTTTLSRGIPVFDSANFEVSNNGWIGIKTSGVATTEIADIGNGSVLGNFTGSATYPRELTPESIIAKGAWNQFNSGTTNGISYSYTFTKAATEGASTFTATSISTSSGAGTLVQRKSGAGVNGFIDAQAYELNGNDVLTYTGTTVEIRTLGGVAILSGTGSSSTATPVTVLGQWALGAGATLEATFSADLAEYYSADSEYEPGTVLVFGGDAEVTTTTQFMDSRVAGVVSTDPAFKMNGQLEGTRACVALQGRVPCKVVGKVRKGDLLTTAGIAGHAAKAINPQVGTIIGKALENKDTLEAGVIEVAVGRV